MREAADVTPRALRAARVRVRELLERYNALRTKISKQRSELRFEPDRWGVTNRRKARLEELERRLVEMQVRHPWLV